MWLPISADIMDAAMLIHAQWLLPLQNRKMGVKKGMIKPRKKRITLVSKKSWEFMVYEQVLMIFAITKPSAAITSRKP